MAKHPMELSVARLKAQHLMPYMIHQVMALVPVARSGLGTLSVDRHWRLYYDPAFLVQRTADEAAFIVLHEALHCYLNHCRRLPESHNSPAALELSNIAKDLAVNSMLVLSRLAAPEDAVLPSEYGFRDGLSCEEYYDLLLQKKQQEEQAHDRAEGDQDREDEEEPEQQGGKDQQEEQGDQEDQAEEQQQEREGADHEESDQHQERQDEGDQGRDGGPDQAQDQGQDQDESPSAGEGEGAEGGLAPGEQWDGSPPNRSAGDGGSSHDGIPRPWECPAPAEGEEANEVPAGPDPCRQDDIRQATARQIEQEAASGRGDIPAGLRRSARDLLHPPVNPVEELKASVRFAVTAVSGFGDYSYRRLPRRRPPGAATMPGHICPLPQVTVIADTSGSMGSDDLGLALGTIAQVIKGLPNPRGVRVLAGDSTVGSAKNVFRPDQVELLGGGGTAMDELIEAAMDEKPRPTVILVVTDAETPWPQEPVAARVIACLTRKPRWCAPPPSWIETVLLNPPEED